MRTRFECRPPEALRDYLSRDGVDPQDALLVEHLDVCEACQRRLEALAAEPDDWASLRARGPSSSSEFSYHGRRDSLRAERLADEIQLSFLDPTDDPRMLGRLGTYEVMGVVGAGGMGLVLKVFDRALNRNLAIKVLAPHLAASPLARRRFAREARAAAAVVHPHVIAVHAVSEFHGLPYLVMPYYPAQSLQHRLDRGLPLALAEILRISQQIASGLSAAHAQGLVHRDIKPANILVEEDIDRVVITDFGLARTIDDAVLTRSGSIAGTPQYMAPEQAREEPADHRADLFSLGSLIYTMCTGRPPFRADTALAVLRKVSEEPPQPIQELTPEIPAWFSEIVATLHAKDPADRCQTAAELAELLQHWLAHVQNPLHVPPPSRPSEDHRPHTSHRRLFSLTIGPLMVMVAVVLLSRSALVQLGPPVSSSPPGPSWSPPIEYQNNLPAPPEVLRQSPSKSSPSKSSPTDGIAASPEAAARMVSDQPPQVSREDQWLNVEQVRGLAANIQCIGTGPDGVEYQPKLISHPLARIYDPVRGRDGTRKQEGSLWAWGAPGRPIAMVEIWRWNGSRRAWGHALVSTTRQGVRAEIGDRTWRPNKPGLDFMPLDQAPEPSAFRETRTQQMRDLAERFSGYEIYRKERIDLERLQEPIYRYESDVLDGGIFLLSHHSNPEAILFIEAASDSDAGHPDRLNLLSHWRFATAPCSSHELHVEYDGQEVATIPEATEYMGSATDPFWVLYVDSSSPVSP